MSLPRHRPNRFNCFYFIFSAWYMLPDGDYDDQKAENRLKEGNKPCTVAELRKLGIA
mgnify:CR=1 FL=1